MKKVLTVILTLAIAILFGLSISTAKAECSKTGEISEPRSEVSFFVDAEKPVAYVIVVVKDGDGNPVCGVNVRMSTSRNQPGGGWPKNVDKISPAKGNGWTDSNGVEIFKLSTKRPAGTTVYIFAGEGEQLGNKDGMPFMYLNPLGESKEGITTKVDV